MNVSPNSEHTLRDGTTATIRPLDPDDRDGLLAMWARTSEESRRQRFRGDFELDEDNVEDFVDLVIDRQVALAATIGRDADHRIVGIARYALDDDGVAEIDILIEDAHQGRGIGTVLLRSLATIAHDRGVSQVKGRLLASNEPMLRLVRDLGLEHAQGPTRSGEEVLVSTSFTLDDAGVTEFLDGEAEDEKVAASAALERFLRPRSVAVVGASRDPQSIGGLVFANLLKGGFSGPVYPVNRTSAVVQSIAAYPDLSACPDVPDLVIVAVPADHVTEVVDEAGRLGVKAVCVVSAGFSEAGPAGQTRNVALMEVVHGHGLRLIGPNCMGVMNAAADYRMNGTFSRTLPRPGRLAFSSQSGALGLAVLQHAEDLGLGISTFVSVGNKADISGNDLLLFWEDDPDTDVILLYLESFGNPRRFSRIARRISRSKPIVAVKSGRTSAGARAASSHTGALASGDVAVEALFRQAGVIRTDTLEELFDVATLLSSQPVPTGTNVAIVTNAGGPGILAADACESNGLTVPALSEATRAQLAEFLPPEAGMANPVDMIASATAEGYGNSLRVVGNADEVDAIFVIFIPAGTTSTTAVAEAIVAARADVPAHKPIISVFMSNRGVPDELAEARIPSFAFPEDAARALGRVARYGTWKARPAGRVIVPGGIDREAGRHVVTAALNAAPTHDGGTGHGIGRSHAAAASGSTAPPSGRSAWLTTAETHHLLDAYGVPVARSQVVRSPEAAADVQREFGTRVAVKVAAPIHKIDVGGVALDIETPEAAAAAVTQMITDLESHGMGEHVASGFQIQEMVDGGVEMVVGVSHDPSFGPIVVTGLGGTLVELLRDVSVRITPLTDIDVEDMLTSLRTYPLLTGYRGSEPVDLPALRDLLHRINAMVEDIPEISELDLNPVFVSPAGVVAVDARIRVASRTH